MRRKWYSDIYLETKLEQWDVLEKIGEDDIQTYLDIKNGKITEQDKIDEFQSDYFYYDVGFDTYDIMDKLDTDDMTEELQNRGYTIKDDDYNGEDDWHEVGEYLSKASYNDNIEMFRSYMRIKRMDKNRLKEFLIDIIDSI